MSPIVHLVRHGEVDNPDHVVYADLNGFGLSERGHRQAEEAAGHLRDRPIVAVYSSPLQRAMETAGTIAASHRLAVQAIPDLTEWFLAQRWKGVGWDDLDAEFPGELYAYLHHPLDLPFSPESVEDLAQRMTAAIEPQAAGLEPSEEMVVVSHQDPIQAARLALSHTSLGGLNVDKPQHAEVFSLRVATPWVEVDRFVPDEQESFPPA